MPSLKARLKLTGKCQNSCSYCYSDKNDGDMTIETGKKIIDELYKIYKSDDDFHRLKIAFSGGDPFQSDLIIKLTKYVKEIFKDIKVLIYGDVCLYSNMSIIEEYIKLGGYCMISLNEDSLDKMIGKGLRIKALKTTPLFNVVLTKFNRSRINVILNEIIKNGFIIRINPLYDPNDPDNLASNAEIEIKNIVNTLIYLKYQMPKSIPLFGNMRVNNPSNSYCGYGIDYFYFYPNGDISRCQLEKPFTNVNENNLLMDLRSVQNKVDLSNIISLSYNSHKYLRIHKRGCLKANSLNKLYPVYKEMAKGMIKLLSANYTGDYNK